MTTPFTTPTPPKPNAPPKRFLGIDLTWKMPKFATDGLPWKVQLYIHRATLAGGLSPKARLEIIDHFNTGMAAGRSPQSLMDGLGSPRKFGSALGRANSPRRWFFARVHTWFTRIFFASILLYLALGLCIRWAKPNPTVDYYALLNQTTLATPKDTHAWPLYRQAMLDPRLHSQRMFDALSPPGCCNDFLMPLQPGDEQWPKARDYLTGLQPLIARLRQGAQKPVLGCPLQPVYTLPEEDQRALSFIPAAPPSPAPAFGNDPVSQLVATQFDESQLVQFASIKNAFLPVIADMNLAAEQSDAARLLADLQALLGVSRQLRQIPLHTARYHAQTLAFGAFTRISQIALAYPDLLSDIQLQSLRTQLLQQVATWDTLPAPENYTMLDRLQRSYTTPQPGGRITKQGVAYLWQAMDPFQKFPTTDSLANNNSVTPELSFTFNYLIFPSAQTVQDWKAQDDADYYTDISTPWSRDATYHYGRVLGSSSYTPIAFIRELPQQLLARDFYNLSGTTLAMNKSQARINDVLLSIAQYRLRHARYPDTPDALVPEFLPQTPTGIYKAGEPLFIRLTPKGLTVYSPGVDGIDDSGQDVCCNPDGSSRQPNDKSGDDVYYPLGTRRIITQPK